MRILTQRTFEMAVIALVLFSSVSVWASGGGGSMDGGGGDRLPTEHGSAWFLGNRTIRYCYLIGNDFGVPRERLESAIEAGFAQWQSYIQGNRIHFDQTVDWQLALSRKLLPACDGSEDLKFYFGVTAPEVDAALKSYVNPVAITQRTSYDVNAGWGKGFIWLGDPKILSETQPSSHGHWSWTGAQYMYPVETQLLHELGHVFGCDHIDGTIMRKDISERIFEPLPPTIDQKRILALGNPNWFFKNRQGRRYGMPLFLDHDVFTLLVGFAPQAGGCKGPKLPGEPQVPCISVQLVPDDSQPDSSAVGSFRVGISITDSFHSRVVWFVPLTKNGLPSAGSSYAVAEPSIFKVARTGAPQWEGGPPTVRARSEALFGFVILGTISDVAGKSYPALMSLNMNYTRGSISNGTDGPLGVFFLDGAVQRPLY